MTIRELVEKLQREINSGNIDPKEEVYYRQLDIHGKLYHKVDYFLLKEDSVVLCEE